MDLLPFVVDVIAYGVVLSVDIAVLFVVIRLLSRRRPIRALAGFDAAGRRLVDSLTRLTATWWCRMSPRPVPSEFRRPVLVLFTLTLVRSLMGLIRHLADGLI